MKQCNRDLRSKTAWKVKTNLQQVSEFEQWHLPWKVIRITISPQPNHIWRYCFLQWSCNFASFCPCFLKCDYFHLFLKKLTPCTFFYFTRPHLRLVTHNWAMSTHKNILDALQSTFPAESSKRAGRVVTSFLTVHKLQVTLTWSRSQNSGSIRFYLRVIIYKVLQHSGKSSKEYLRFDLDSSEITCQWGKLLHCLTISPGLWKSPTKKTYL